MGICWDVAMGGYVCVGEAGSGRDLSAYAGKAYYFVGRCSGRGCLDELQQA